MDIEDYDVIIQIFEERNAIVEMAEALRSSGLVCVRFDDSREKGLGKLLRAIAIFREFGFLRKEIDAHLVTGFAFSFFTGLLPEAIARAPTSN